MPITSLGSRQVADAGRRAGGVETVEGPLGVLDALTRTSCAISGDPVRLSTGKQRQAIENTVNQWQSVTMAGTVNSPRFLTLADVAEVLSTSTAQVYALVRRKELPAIKIGGRGQYRVEASKLEEFIARSYAQTEVYLDDHPFVETPSAETGPDHT